MIFAEGEEFSNTFPKRCDNINLSRKLLCLNSLRRREGDGWNVAIKRRKSNYASEKVSRRFAWKMLGDDGEVLFRGQWDVSSF